MSVSVIIPVYNSEKYIGEAIASALKQKEAKEVIVVDDGSTDGTSEKVKSFGPKIIYIYQENQGVAAARNRGAIEAGSPYLAFLDADDLWHEKKLTKQLKGLKDHSLDMIFTYVRHFQCESASGEYTKSQQPMPGLFASTLLITKAALKRTGGFSEQHRVGEFIDWYSRAQDIGLKGTTLQEVLAYRRIHDANMTIQMRDAYRGYAKVLREHIRRKRC